MSIHVILGKPGSGKSLYATSRVLDELVNGSRNVVTNLPLHPGRLNEYIQQKHPQLDARLVQRLRILTDDEIKSFWDFRGPDGDKGAKGVAYFLDEAPGNGPAWANRLCIIFLSIESWAM
jgi:zona occludens toxin (predicted ATPase)